MGRISVQDIYYEDVAHPEIAMPTDSPEIPADVYAQRLHRVRDVMQQEGLDTLVVYADREHFANFHYLVGFEPRFEEGLLVVHQEGKTTAFLGNECVGLTETSKIPVEPLLCQVLSLPSQPMDKSRPLEEQLRSAGLKQNSRVGLVGWKYFTHVAEPEYTFDLPAFIVKAVIGVVGDEHRVVNATPIFIAPDRGLRTTSEPVHIAVMEFGSSLASTGVDHLIQNLRPGISELEVAKHLVSKGVPLSCHPMATSGSRSKHGLLSPSSRKISLGDTFTTAFGVQGGLTSRAGYVANTVADLPVGAKDWIEVIVKPFYAAVASWYETVGLGVAGGVLYDTVQAIIPKEQFGWVLNPGHLISLEEWQSSPIFSGSEIQLRSGMAIQMDIIPSPPVPYFTTNVEDGIVLADSDLREALKKEYPDVWKRMEQRREFMIDELGINLKPEVLPMSNIPALLRPLLLNKENGMRVRR